MNTKSPFINELVNIQETNHYSDGKMAELIGCSRQLYQATRNGKITVGLTILRGGIKAFPQLRNVGVIFAEVVGITPSQTTQDGKSGRFKTWCKGFISRCRKIWHNSREL